MLRVDEAEVYPATINGGLNNAFFATTLIFNKPRWISDQDALNCAICRNRFNQLRRRHHCRCCGKVLCNKCCTEKVPLPQYGLDNPERVCNGCVPVATCITMSYSNDPAFHLKAATGLSSLCRDSPSSVVSLGGAHVLISLVRNKSLDQIQTLSQIASALHSLCRHESLSLWLTNVGIFSAIARILQVGLNAMRNNNVTAITDCLSSIRILVKPNDKFKVLVFDTGCFPTLLRLCEHPNSSVSLIATSTLSMLAECSTNHAAFIAEQDGLRSLLMRITESSDEQVKVHVLRIIVVLSTGNDDVKHIITSEDAASGGVLAHALQSKPGNLQIVASAASAIANLATCEKDQVLLQSSMRAVLGEMRRDFYPEYVMVQLVRAVANFSRHPGHASTLLSSLHNLVKFLSSSGSNINHHAVKCIFNLLRYRNKETVSMLCKNGVENFLLRVSELDEVMIQVVKSLSVTAPSIAS